jgi:Leucine-rich repeat (LRR) protein
MKYIVISLLIFSFSTYAQQPVGDTPLPVTTFEENTTVDLMGQNLKTIPANVLKNKNVKVLWLRSNEITELHPDLALCIKIEELSLGSNPIKDMEKTIAILAKLPNLTQLDLEQTGMKRVPDNIVQLKSLKKLYIWGNPFDNAELERVKKLLPNVKVQ